MPHLKPQHVRKMLLAAVMGAQAQASHGLGFSESQAAVAQAPM